MQSPCAQVQLGKSVTNRVDRERGVRDDVRGSALAVGVATVLVNRDLDVELLWTTI